MNSVPLQDDSSLWSIRATEYDKLYWTRDEGYVKEILRLADLDKSHTVLDVGTGTGTIARAARERVRHVVGMDMSEAMLGEGDWSGISVVRWDIGESLFAPGVFHRVLARMVFHHILGNLDRAVLRCYDLLRDGGKIVVAEGVPPADDDEVVTWYSRMFSLKEKRRTFLPAFLIGLLQGHGFRNIVCSTYYMEDFSVLNWISNCGLPPEVQETVMKLHREAPKKIKDAYNMRLTEKDCVIRTKNVVVVGSK